MKKFIVFVIVMTAAAVCFAQSDPAVGFWLSVDENTNTVTAAWQIYIDNGILYGKIVSISAYPRGITALNCRERYNGFPVPGRVNTMPVAGTPWLFGLRKRADGDWRGGNIINPEDGRMYSCRITFHPAGSRSGRRTFQTDTLEMRGEISPGLGRSQFWQRTDERTAGSLWPD